MGDTIESFSDLFVWHSSSVDWCEANYEVSPHVAEFWNTVSNVPFVIGSIISMVLAWPHVEVIGWGPFLTYALMLFIGLGSMYFHATLSYAGQMVDEWAIIWLVMLCVYAYLPKEYAEAIGIMTHRQWGWAVFSFTASVTAGPYVFGPDFAFWVAPVLMACGFLVVFVILKEARKNLEVMDYMAKYLVTFSLVTFLLAVTSWMVDKILCHHVHEWPVQLHAIWHLLVYVAGHTTLTYLAYMRVLLYESHRIKPDIHFFPRKYSRVGLSYLHLSLKNEKGQ